MTYFIAGANRGIGLALVQHIAEQGSKVFATTRDIDSDASTDLNQYAASHPNVKVIPLEVTDEQSIAAALKLVESEIDHLDVLIVNAGIVGSLVGLDQATRLDLDPVLDVNVFAPLNIFRAFTPLLKASKQKAIFMAVSSAIGSSTVPFQHNSLPYALAKNALNHLMATINFQNDFVTAFPTHPGMVETRMSKSYAEEQGFSLQQASEMFGVTVETPITSAIGLVNLIDRARQDPEKYGGKFWSYDNAETALAY